MTGLQIKMILLAVTFGILSGLIAYYVTKNVTRAKRSSDERVSKIVGARLGSQVVLEKNRVAGKIKLNIFNRRKSDVYVERKSLIDRIGDSLFEELLSADIVMRPEEFATIWVILAFVPAALSSLFLSNALLSIILVVGGVAGPIVFIETKKKKRTTAFEEQLADALLIACNSLRTGLSFQQAMETISHDMYPPISEEFARAVNEMNMGVSIDDALDNICKRIHSDDFKIVAVAVSVQRQTGGSLSEILQTISDTIKERYELKKEIKSITASGRMSGGIVGAMPIFVTLILNVTSKGYMDPMFQSSGGRVAIAVGIGLECVGLFTIKKITDIKY